MQSNTPTFEDTESTETTVEENPLDHEVNDDANLDVDVPPGDEDGDEVPQESEGTKAESTPAKAARPKAPEGFVKPVEFAKLLSEHLSTPEKKVTVPPQVVYSYIKNNVGESAKNPFPIHSQDGYDWYIKPEEGLAWWDAKNTRVAAGKTARAEKAAKAAAKATETPTVEAEGNDGTVTAPVVEAE